MVTVGPVADMELVFEAAHGPHAVGRRPHIVKREVRLAFMATIRSLSWPFWMQIFHDTVKVAGSHQGRGE